jgi:hypothetical protein
MEEFTIHSPRQEARVKLVSRSTITFNNSIFEQDAETLWVFLRRYTTSGTYNILKEKFLEEHLRESRQQPSTREGYDQHAYLTRRAQHVDRLREALSSLVDALPKCQEFGFCNRPATHRRPTGEIQCSRDSAGCEPLPYGEALDAAQSVLNSTRS